MSVNYPRLMRLYEVASPQQAAAELREAFAARSIRPQDIDLGELFSACFGEHEFRAVRSGRSNVHDVFREAAGAVSTTAFQNISGQFMYQTVLDGYAREPQEFAKLIPEATASTLDGEKIPGITEMGDEVQDRPEGDAYAIAGVGEDWVLTPPIVDRGVEIHVTWEAVFNDKTGQLLERAGNVGWWAAVNREKRAIDCCIDENRTKHRYNWRGVTIASYGDNSGTHSWDNLAASNALVDWTDLDNAEQVFNAITDPYTGEPVPWEPKHLTVTKQLEQTAHHILRSNTIYRATPGWATTGNPNLNEVANPYLSKYMPVTSRLLASRLATDTDWFLADWSVYAKCMMAEKLNVAQAPAGSPEEFHRRIVAMYRVNERYEYIVVQPRASVKSTA